MKKTGFSLIELMISLIIISIITAAFSPVVTKKLKASGAAYIASGGSASTICNIQSNADCKLCTKNTADGLCLLCEATCTKGQYLDYDQCTCRTCTDSNCALCSEKECLKCKPGYDLFKGSCVKTCGDKDVLRISGTDIDICMTKYNMGDKRKFPIPNTVRMLKAGNPSDKCNNNELCCWYGITANKDNCNSDNGDYSGCGRTVCNWYAAREICSKLNLGGYAWRLPTLQEAKNISSDYTKIKDNEGLMLCTPFDTDGYSTCGVSSNNCFKDGSSNTICYPYYIWTDDQVNINNAFVANVFPGAYTSTLTYSKNSGVFSVRCVRSDDPAITAPCTVADSNCQSCSSDGTTCARCNSGFELKDGVCTKYCGPNFYYDKTTNTCQACPTGFFCDGYNQVGACHPYYSHTAECYTCNDTSCHSCRNGQIGVVYAGKCTAGCPPHCTGCIGKVGYTVCSGCDPNYSVNPSTGLCELTSCPAGYYCTGGEVHSCSTFAGTGSSCSACDGSGCKPEGCRYGKISHGICQKCGTGNVYCLDGSEKSCSDFNEGVGSCESCNRDQGCSVGYCKNGYLAKEGGISYCKSIANCQIYNDRGCTRCKANFLLESDTLCTECPDDSRGDYFRPGTTCDGTSVRVSCETLWGQGCNACTYDGGCTRCYLSNTKLKDGRCVMDL